LVVTARLSAAVEVAEVTEFGRAEAP
jgi:hypothetical protein